MRYRIEVPGQPTVEGEYLDETEARVVVRRSGLVSDMRDVKVTPMYVQQRDDRETKQVIVIRKDLKMRRGKEIAQGAHAAMIWLSNRLVYRYNVPDNIHGDWPPVLRGGTPRMSAAEEAWLLGAFRKITVRVNSEEQLLNVKRMAEDAGLEVHLVTDAGLTEFGGVPTHTALAIGPDYADLIDPVTRDLELY